MTRDEVSPDLRAFAWAMNQTVARIAVIFHGVAMMLFGCQAFLIPSRWLDIPTRVFGVMAGFLSIGILVMHYSCGPPTAMVHARKPAVPYPSSTYEQAPPPTGSFRLERKFGN
ncbi:MAG: hypothetical protein Q8M16_21495 [Pirellulaceae bacterium]|nr:hypothetical protein [Pirellulaceae bacterium]